MSKKKKNAAPPTPPESLGLPPCGADSHAHLDDKRFSDDLDAVLERARASGLSHIGNVFTSLEEWDEASPRLSGYSELFFSDRLWPDFDEAALDQALAAYAERERRFGQTPEQVARSAAA